MHYCFILFRLLRNLIIPMQPLGLYERCHELSLWAQVNRLLFYPHIWVASVFWCCHYWQVFVLPSLKIRLCFWHWAMHECMTAGLFAFHTWYIPLIGHFSWWYCWITHQENLYTVQNHAFSMRKIVPISLALILRPGCLWTLIMGLLWLRWA